MRWPRRPRRAPPTSPTTVDAGLSAHSPSPAVDTRPRALPPPRARAPWHPFSLNVSPFSRRGLPHLLYRLSLYACVCLLILVLLGAVYDVEHQLVTGQRSTRAGDISIVAAAGVLLAILAFAISISRVVTVKGEFMAIPKPYQPITREDVPKAVHTLISTEYNRSAIIAHIAQPRPQQLDGWSARDADGNCFRFRDEILKSFDSVVRPLEQFDVPQSNASPRGSRFRPYLPLLFGYAGTSSSPAVAGLLPRALVGLVREYDEVLQRARFERKEPTQEDWELAVRAASVIIKLLLARC